MAKFATFSAVVCSLQLASYSFNIDTKFPIIKHQSGAEYFGYSVAQHEMPDSTSRMVVGAPRAGTNHTGAIYSCTLSLGPPSAECQELAYPVTNSKPVLENYEYEENKTDMWLGVSLSSGGKGHSVLACAHRYQAFNEYNNLGLGMCYRYNSSLDLTLDETQYVMPCTQDVIVGNTPKSGFGLCQAGTSHGLWENEAVIGLPGALTWSGSSTWAFVGDGRSRNRATVNTVDEPANYIERGSYLGSATAIAQNMLDTNELTVAIGAPRHGDTGRVHVFTMSNVNQTRGRALQRQRDRTLIGEQYGSSFGQTLATIDIKGNSRSSLVVGAPYYRSNSSTSVGGAIYIYYNHGNGILPDVSRVLVTPGECSLDNRAHCYDAMFGHAISSLRDINGDGLHDLAVGAPYYGAGAVFIYIGRMDGTLNPDPSQVVMASSLNKPDISSFGISLSGGANMDGQAYTDLLVGAFKSSHAVVLRSRLVVTITGFLSVDEKMIETTSAPKCANGNSLQCPKLSVCFNYTVNQPSGGVVINPTADIYYNITLDAGYEFASARRLSFTATGPVESTKFDESASLSTQNTQCVEHTIYIQKIQDIIKDMVITLKYRLKETENANLNDFPILNKTSPKPSPIKLQFRRDCQTDACDTDLGVRAAFTSSEVVHDKKAGNNTFVFTSNQVEQLAVRVTLTVGSSADIDHAYEPELVAILPPSLGYKSFESSSIVAQCEDQVQRDNTTKILCAFARKMDRGTSESVTFKLDHDNLTNKFSNITFSVTTTSKDTVPANNAASLRVRVVTVTDLEVVGTATAGDEVTYGSGDVRGLASIRRDDEIGDYVQHTYTLYNANGRIPRVTFTVQWPYEVPGSGSRGHYLLYMTGTPVRTTSENGVDQIQCATIPGEAAVINPENYQVVNDGGYSVIDQSGRRKREVGRTSAIRTFYSNEGNARKVAMLNCRDQTARCFNYTCDIINLRPYAEVRLRFNARLWNSTLLDLYGNDVSSVEITSQASVTIDPAFDVVQNITSNDYANVTTVAIPDISLSKSEDVPYWIYIVAAAGGLLLLVVIVLLFWKCGFFKRHRPIKHAVTVDKKEKTDKYQAVGQTD